MADDNSALIVQIQLDDGTVKQGFAKIQEEGTSTFQAIGEVAAGVFAAQVLSNFGSKLSAQFSEALQAASDYGDQVQRLNNNLALSGRYSEQNSKQFTDLADSIQATTAYSDDTVLSIAALASNFSKTTAQTEKLTKASLDFAAATGKDANEAAQALALTLNGVLTREVSRFFPQLKELSQSALESGAAIDFIGSRFSGSAAANANTYGASVKQLSNAYDDFLKSIGQYITESPTAIATLKTLAQAFLGLADGINGFRQGSDVLHDFAKAAVTTGIVLTEDLGRPLESIIRLFSNFALVAAASAETGVGLATKRIDIIKGGVLNLIEAVKGIPAALKNLGGDDTTISDKIIAGLDLYSKAIDTAAVKTKQFVNQTPGELGVFVDTIGTIFDNLEAVPLTFGQIMDTFAQEFQNAIDKVVETTKAGLGQAATQAFQGFANAVGSGFAAIGKALVKGQDVFKAFAGALLSGIGQAAIQMGSFYILLGLARLLSTYGADPTGYTLLGVGASLAVLGGALSAFGDGVTGTSNPATSVNTGGGSAIDTGATTSTATASSMNTAQTTPGVTVNIQGDVLDSNESGLRIIDLINQQFNTSGARVLAT